MISEEEKRLLDPDGKVDSMLRGISEPLSELGREALRVSIQNGYNKATALERLALIHSEVSECVEAIRRGDKTYFEVDGKPEGPLSELADVIIRTVEMAAWLEPDSSLDDMVRAKMAYNKVRKDVPVRDGSKII
jgi:NTP pyrophosphatase (non-canonical NTP hydrolase)